MIPGGSRIALASWNSGKLEEIKTLLHPYGLSVVSAGELGVPAPPEEGETFRENAQIKAVAVAHATGFPALADDSGLAVRALNGEPGVHSARWASGDGKEGKPRNYTLAMKKIMNGLEGQDDRRAYFVCVLALCIPPKGISPGDRQDGDRQDGDRQDHECHFFEGYVHGQITLSPRGDKGFGYDPIFQPQEYEMTFAEMTGNMKSRISHRARALERFIASLETG